MRSKFTLLALVAAAIGSGACGGSGAFEYRPAEVRKIPDVPPGSGQLGPGYVSEDEGRIYGRRNATGEVNSDGYNGNAGPGEHQEHNRLPGTGNRP